MELCRDRVLVELCTMGCFDGAVWRQVVYTAGAVYR